MFIFAAKRVGSSQKDLQGGLRAYLLKMYAAHRCLQGQAELL